MRRRQHARPGRAYTQRAIVAFPEPTLGAVETFRAMHDPLSARIPAHVTLVFPFASNATDVQVLAHMRRVLRRWPCVPITLSGVSAYAAQWVHLRVSRGRDAIIEMHDRLYRRALSPFLKREFTYEPHVTIGRAARAEDCDRMLSAARDEFRAPIAAVLREVVLIGVASSGAIEHRALVPLGL